MRQSEVALQPRGEGDPKTEHCKVCGSAIKTMCFLGTGVCGENHRKAIVKVEAAVEAERIERAEASLIK